MPRGLELLPLSRPGLRGSAERERGSELLQLGRSAQHLGPRREHADVDWELERRRARARERRVRDAAPTLSAWLLLEGLRRPDRRPERGLEGPRPLGAERRSHAVAQGRRQGHEAARRALPGAPGLAREVAGENVDAACLATGEAERS